MDSVEKLSLQGLMSAADKSKKEDKHFFVFDQNGNVETFFNYQANLNDFNKDVMKV